MLSDGLDVSSRRQRWRHVPRQQFVDAVDRMVSNALEHVGEIRLGIEAVQACRADQVCDSQTSFHFFEGRFFGASEPVAPVGNTRSDARR